MKKKQKNCRILNFQTTLEFLTYPEAAQLTNCNNFFSPTTQYPSYIIEKEKKTERKKNSN